MFGSEQTTQKTCDVLVVGGGLAGMRAAMAAAERGARTVILSKSPVGRSGASLVATGVMAAAFRDDDSPELHAADIIRSSRNLADPALARILAEEGPREVANLGALGVEMIQSILPVAGHSVARHRYPPIPEDHPLPKGRMYTYPIRDRLPAAGITLIEGYWATDLLVRAGRVAGVAARSQDDRLLIEAGAVVMATGGPGRLYSRTDNPSDLCGDGIAIAWRRGASLRDMEFAQFWPVGYYHPRNIVGEGFFLEHGARWFNERGEDIFAGIAPKEVTRDRGSQIMWRAGKVRADLSAVPLDIIRAEDQVLYKLLATGYTGPIFASPIQHFFMGGLQIDADGATTLPGLYAAGECTGGVHGANRLGGNALTECLVFGARAGRSAAGVALQGDAPTGPLEPYRSGDAEGAGSLDAAGLVSRLRSTMSDKVGIVRTEDGLRHALGIIEEIRSLAPECNRADGKQVDELGAMLDLAGLVARAALMRQESRGAHARDDFPEESPDWQGSIWIEGNDLQFKRAGG